MIGSSAVISKSMDPLVEWITVDEWRGHDAGWKRLGTVVRNAAGGYERLRVNRGSRHAHTDDERRTSWQPVRAMPDGLSPPAMQALAPRRSDHLRAVRSLADSFAGTSAPQVTACW